MKVLFFTNNLFGKDGWSRYSLELIDYFLSETNLEIVCCLNKLKPKLKVIQYPILREPLHYLRYQAQNIINGASIMQNVESEMTFLTEAETANNSIELISEVRKACLDIGLESDSIIDNYLVPGSEDATFIMNEVIRNGGLSTYIGIGSPTFGGHHNDQFDFDEDILPKGVNLLYQLAKNVTNGL